MRWLVRVSRRPPCPLCPVWAVELSAGAGAEEVAVSCFMQGSVTVRFLFRAVVPRLSEGAGAEENGRLGYSNRPFAPSVTPMIERHTVRRA